MYIIIKKYLLSNNKLVRFELGLIITIKLQPFFNTKNAVQKYELLKYFLLKIILIIIKKFYKKLRKTIKFFA